MQSAQSLMILPDLRGYSCDPRKQLYADPQDREICNSMFQVL